VTVNSPGLLILNQDDCQGSGHSVTAEEDKFIDIGRNRGSDIVGYYINSLVRGNGECSYLGS
jgi:hypothetical protein